MALKSKTHGNGSLSESLASLPVKKRQQIINELSDEEAYELLYDWKFWARPSQLAPEGDWNMWLYLAGRGTGKTRSAAEWVRANVDKYPIFNLVGKTPAAVREDMVEGESGLLNIFPPDKRPNWEPSKRKITFYNGAIGRTYSGAEPDMLRGPQCYAFWVDELPHFKYPQETFDNLMFGFRLGAHPRGVITTTPKPIKVIKDLLTNKSVRVTRGTTYENIANLPQVYIEQIIKPYEGTRLGRQELHAEILDEVEGALWTHNLIERSRVQAAPELKRIVVGVDPAVTSKEGSDETGIIVAGRGHDDHGYILADLSLRGTPNRWASQAVRSFYEFKADRIIGEVNNGGDLIESVLRNVDQSVSYKSVHASRGKYTRAEPVSAMYEQFRIHHVGTFGDLEDQMATWVPGDKSPDRMDALVWALTELFLVKENKFWVA